MEKLPPEIAALFAGKPLELPPTAKWELLILGRPVLVATLATGQQVKLPMSEESLAALTRLLSATANIRANR